jgi:hypothetical protein
MFKIDGNTRNVGIGTSSPAAKLDVSAALDGYAAIFTNTGGTAARKGLKIKSGQGTVTATNYFIQCFDANGGDRGGVVVTDGGVCHFAQSCDASFKTDITDSPMQGLEIVKGIPVRSFRIGEGKLQDGFVAQEVESLYPQAVAEVVDEPTTATGPGAHKALLPLALIPPLFRAVQEQDERILQLEKEVAALSELAAPRAASASAQSSVPGSQSSVLSTQSCLQPLPDAEVLRLTESVLRRMGIEPWVEITAAEAWEEVDETAPVPAVETVTRYRFNPDTRLAEAYSVEDYDWGPVSSDPYNFAWITPGGVSTPPQMPLLYGYIVANGGAALPETADWHLHVTFNRPTRNDSDTYPTGAPGYATVPGGQEWVVNFGGDFRGGKATTSCAFGGKTLTHVFHIRGYNASEQTTIDYINAHNTDTNDFSHWYAKKIARKESSLYHFNPATTQDPLPGPNELTDLVGQSRRGTTVPYGWGLFQLTRWDTNNNDTYDVPDDFPTPNHLWNWKTNTARAIDLLRRNGLPRLPG